MTNFSFKRAHLASGTRVQISARVVGQTILLPPPMLLFGCVAILAYVLAPFAVGQSEAALEDSAWVIGRVWAGGVALSHLFEGGARHRRIEADGSTASEPPRPNAPIVVVPQPDIGAPPLMPRRGGRPPEVKPKRKHRHVAHPPELSAEPPDTLMPAPVPPHEPEGGAP